MKSFKTFIQLTEAFSNFKYKIPKNKSELLFDFYTLISLPIWGLTDEKRNTDELKMIIEDSQQALINYLKPHQLEAVLFAICAEFRHIFQGNTPKEIVSWARKNKAEKFMKHYITTYKLSDFGFDAILNRDEFKSRFSEDTRGYQDSYKAVKTSKIKDMDFIKLAMDAFNTLLWSSNYGGKPWASICAGWIRLYNAKSYDDKIVAIDHVFDLQHNTDTVFNKIRSYSDANGSYKWIKVALNKKRDAISLFAYYNDISPQLKSFVAHVVKVATGETLEAYMKKVPTTVKKLNGAEKYIKNLPNRQSPATDEMTWKGGVWKGGTWEGGTWEGGTWEGGVWKDGIWHNGYWKGGNWKGGTWEGGVWKDGIWHNGYWKGGNWKGGVWKDGDWYKGTWLNGVWKDGIWHDGYWKGGTWETGVWKDGIWHDGYWKGGTWETGVWKGGLIFDPKKIGNYQSYWKWTNNYVYSPISPNEYFAKEK
jgi:hypothetical protein